MQHKSKLYVAVLTSKLQASTGVNWWRPMESAQRPDKIIVACKIICSSTKPPFCRYSFTCLQAWHFFTVCVPVVVIAAPIGSVIATHFHRWTFSKTLILDCFIWYWLRKVLASMIYILDTVALVTALTVLHMTPKLWIISGCLLAGLRHLHHTNLNRSMSMHIVGSSSAFVCS